MTVIPSERLLLRVPEAADRLGVSRSTLYELMGSGRIRGVKIGAAVRIPADELRAYVESLKSERLGDTSA
jgi:excisionase family DNA binding protein